MFENGRQGDEWDGRAKIGDNDRQMSEILVEHQWRRDLGEVTFVHQDAVVHRQTRDSTVAMPDVSGDTVNDRWAFGFTVWQAKVCQSSGEWEKTRRCRWRRHSHVQLLQRGKDRTDRLVKMVFVDAHRSYLSPLVMPKSFDVIAFVGQVEMTNVRVDQRHKSSVVQRGKGTDEISWMKVGEDLGEEQFVGKREEMHHSDRRQVNRWQWRVRLEECRCGRMNVFRSFLFFSLPVWSVRIEDIDGDHCVGHEKSAIGKSYCLMFCNVNTRKRFVRKNTFDLQLFRIFAHIQVWTRAWHVLHLVNLWSSSDILRNSLFSSFLTRSCRDLFFPERSVSILCCVLIVVIKSSAWIDLLNVFVELIIIDGFVDTRTMGIIIGHYHVYWCRKYHVIHRHLRSFVSKTTLLGDSLHLPDHHHHH